MVYWLSGLHFFIHISFSLKTLIYSISSARVTTHLRVASENFHTMKNSYKVFENIHHTRLEAVGIEFIKDCNAKLNTHLGDEWAEYSVLYLEFLASTALFNRFHPKFKSRHCHSFLLISIQK